MNLGTNDFYGLLSLHRNATQQQIQHAFYELARKWHPDKNQEDPYAEQIFKTINKAYQTLSDPAKRQEYDNNRDDNDDDITIGLSKLRLHMGQRLSEKYEESILRWMAEYPNICFSDNFDREFSSIINNVLSMIKENHADKAIEIRKCPLCLEVCYDEQKHMLEAQQPFLAFIERDHYENLNEQLALNLPEEWDFQAIHLPSTSIYKNLWLTKTWNTVPNIVSQFQQCIDLLENRMNLTGIMYVQLARDNPNLEAIARTTPLGFLLDANLLKKAIDYENRSRSDIALSDSKDDFKRRKTIKEQCIVTNIDTTTLFLRNIYYEVTIPPNPIPLGNRSECLRCKRKFFFFRVKYNCRMCGEVFCSNCLVWQTCLHLGFNFPVLICSQCVVLKETIIVNILKRNILEQKFSDEQLSMLIALLHCYNDAQSKGFFQEAGKLFYNSNRFQLALQCYYYCSLQSNEINWFSFAEDMCQRSAYSLALTCFDIVNKLYAPGKQFWIQRGDAYINKQDVFSPLQTGVLALFAYRQAQLNGEAIVQKCISIHNPISQLLFMLYAKPSTKQATDMLSNPNLCGLAIFYLHLINLSIDEWMSILNQFYSTSKFDILIHILSTIDKKLVSALVKHQQSTTIVRCLSSIILGNNPIDIFEWLNFIWSDLDKANQIIQTLSFLHLYCKVESWATLTETYATQKCYDKAMVCYKMNGALAYDKQQATLNWLEKGITEGDSIAFAIKNFSITNWQTLGNQYFSSKQFKAALRCYLIAETSTDYIIAQSRSLPDSEALFYHLAIFKRIINNSKLVAQTIETICECMKKLNRPIVPILASVLRWLINDDEFTSVHAIRLQFQLVKELSKEIDYFEIYYSGLHVLTKYKNMSEELANMIRQYHSKFTLNEIRGLTYISIVALASRLRHIVDASIVRQVFNSCVTGQNIDNFPDPYRAMLYLMEGIIDKLECRCIEAVNKLLKAMTCSPSDETIEALAIIMNDSYFQQRLLRILTLDIKNITNSDGPLIAQIQTRPQTFNFENRLKSNPYLNLIRKNERAFSKQFCQDKYKCAMAYIDLCMATQDPTCLASNMILASICIYEILLTADDAATIYAYRNLIIELCIGAYMLAQHHLAPHMQIYINKLVLTLLIKTTKRFRQSLSQESSQARNQKTELVITQPMSIILSETMKRIINLSKIFPFFNLPTSLSYDVIYLELVGREFIEKFLDIRVITDPSHIYRYYQLEGIWQGWISSQDFNSARELSMSTLLETRNWDMFDVQHLLHHPLIPRTNDGWLTDKREPLGLLGQQYFVKVDGISLNIETGDIKLFLVPAKNKSEALLSNIDLNEVFNKGITQAIFTLEQPDSDLLSHPFQEMRYGPTSLLHDTQYLATLLHTDYLLKMITTGTEVCAISPFPMEKQSNILRRLPKRLQELLKPLHQREKTNSRWGNAHRFWIEAGDLIYEQTINSNETEITYRFGDVKMFVKKHLLEYDEQGNLIDDIVRNNSNLDESAEGLFAKAFTDNYDEIGSYFPELLRLKELLKLGALLSTVQNYYANLIKSTIIDQSPIEKMLNSIKSQIGEYPRATTANVNHYYWSALNEQNISSAHVPSHVETEFKNKILSQLREADKNCVQQIASQMCRQFHSNDINYVESIVDNWLRYNSEQSLINFIVNAKTNHQTMLMNKIERFNISLKRQTQFEFKHVENVCCWVPAVFFNMEDNPIRVYGGVSLLLNLTEGRVPRSSAATSYNVSQLVNSSGSSSGRPPSGGSGGNNGNGNGNGNDGNGGDRNKSILAQLKESSKRQEDGKPIYETNGGMKKAKADFDLLSGPVRSAEDSKGGTMLIKDLGNGETAVLREISTDRRITLEIQRLNTKKAVVTKCKFRYND